MGYSKKQKILIFSSSLFFLFVLGVMFFYREVYAVVVATLNLTNSQSGHITCNGGTLRSVALDQTGLRYELHCEGGAAQVSPTPVSSASPPPPSSTTCNPTIEQLPDWQNATTITNPYLPMPVGLVNTLEGGGESVRVTVTEQTKVVAGVTTRVVEEYETVGGVLSEISYNYFAQAPDGTVCYFGEDVDVYSNGQVTGHGGSWLAGEGQNKAGVMMPAAPAIGQKFRIEDAPGITIEEGEVTGVGVALATPARGFDDVVTITENYTEISYKAYARGVGMIRDNDMLLVSSNQLGSSNSPSPSPSTNPSPSPSAAASPPAGDILPPTGVFPITERIINFTEMPQNLQDKVNALHPAPPAIILETKYEEYANGAKAYGIEYVIEGHRWDVGITVAGTVFRDELELVP